ncbi:ABC transporter permease [Thalassotalea agarivorans]|uniref:ABC-2 type transport system permease protein n=1 Tax=Thalassotalea agarivorans TaxID=349064 RepID=A0A1I0GCQ3_THASX|nr:ABC transporter permease [Thalassotalea agarivorans]SET67988.1 ABC-2 type transport system permease protein [Thalassotalea agarivorans]
MNTFSQGLRTFYHSLKADKWLFVLTCFAPMLMSLIIWLIFSAHFATQLPVAVVDQDKTTMSRALIRYYDASPTISINKTVEDISSAQALMNKGDVYAIIIIPKYLERETVKGSSPTVTTRYNSQYVLIGKLIKSALVQAHGTFNAMVEIIRNTAATHGNVALAMSEALPINQQITSLYNGKNDYAQFLVAAAVPALWQIIIMAATVLFLEKNKGQLLVQNQARRKTFWLLIKGLLPFSVLFFAQTLLFFMFALMYANWPFNGNFAIMITACFIATIACQSLAAFLYSITLDAARAMSLVAGMAAPAFAFMGITFPSSDMPVLALIWRSLLPASHYIELQNQQMNYGTVLFSTFSNLLSLFAFAVLLVAASYIFYKRQPQGETQC